MQDLIPYNRVTIRPGDTGHPVGVAVNVSARWAVYTSPNTPRLSAAGEQGRHFAAGETWRGLDIFRPTDTPVGRVVNFHDIPQPGVGWPSAVSPVALDVNHYMETDPPGVGSSWSIQYGSNCAGHGTHKHTRFTPVWNAWHFLWWEILWSTACTGRTKVWLTTAQTGPNVAPLADYTNIRTIKDDPGLGDGVTKWNGAYKTGYSSGPDAVVDVTPDFVGKEWRDVWNDVPRFVSTWGSAKSTIVRDHGTLRAADIVIPTEIARAIGDVPPPPDPVTGDFSWTPTAPKVGDPVTFAVKEPDAAVAYTWDRTLDGVLDWQGESYTYPYQSPGTKTMVLYANGQRVAAHDLVIAEQQTDPIALRVLASDSRTITLGWTPPPGQEGYLPTIDGSDKLTDGKRHPGTSETQATVKIGKKRDGQQHDYGVEILGAIVKSSVRA